MRCLNVSPLAPVFQCAHTRIDPAQAEAEDELDVEPPTVSIVDALSTGVAIDLLPYECTFEEAAELSFDIEAVVKDYTGDVLLCDNYRVLHGRDVFEGDRLHAVSWFGDGNEDIGYGKSAATGGTLNGVINKLIGD